MTTILITFGLALCISLVLTPCARWFGIRFGAVDVPNARKAHAGIMPRTGGLALFVSFFLVLLLIKPWWSNLPQPMLSDREFFSLLGGASLAFGIGFVDDFHRVHAGIKFLVHVAAASVAFWGGLRIGALSFFGGCLTSDLCSYVLTVGWIVLIINAVNLVDGLDGLAGGIAVFACVVMVVLCVISSQYFIGLLYAALGGAAFGFLRYNFNPASIFLGDGGSYFLGYSIAALAISGQNKTQVSAALLIPVLALGVPLFDTLLAPVRRFIRGKGLFSPDSKHIHHRLREMGLNTKSVVWVLYGITCGLCILAVIIVNLRDERAGILLILLGAGAVFMIRKLGYFNYFAKDRIFSWLRDVSDVTGLTHERRSFLDVQMDMSESKDVDGLWANTIRGVDLLKFDMAKIVLRQNGEPAARGRGGRSEEGGPEGAAAPGVNVEKWLGGAGGPVDMEPAVRKPGLKVINPIRRPGDGAVRKGLAGDKPETERE